MASTKLRIDFKQKFINDIKSKNFKNLIQHLREYESYSISKNNLEDLIKLNLYAVTSMVDQKIYDDYLNNLKI
jgi:hypothetical protein